MEHQQHAECRTYTAPGQERPVTTSVTAGTSRHQAERLALRVEQRLPAHPANAGAELSTYREEAS